MHDIESAKKILQVFDEGRAALTKHAFTPMAPPAPPATAGPPPGAPPMDPAMAGGAPPPPPGDPNAMPPGGAPPMDPAMAGGPPPPPGPEAGGAPPPAAGGIPPELEQQLTQMAQGVGGVVDAVESQQANMDQITDRVLELEQKLDEVSQKEHAEDVRAQLKQPAGFEGPEAMSTPAEASSGAALPPLK